MSEAQLSRRFAKRMKTWTFITLSLEPNFLDMSEAQYGVYQRLENLDFRCTRPEGQDCKNGSSRVWLTESLKTWICVEVNKKAAWHHRLGHRFSKSPMNEDAVQGQRPECMFAIVLEWGDNRFSDFDRARLQARVDNAMRTMRS